jgi:serine/threonine protein kinase
VASGLKYLHRQSPPIIHGDIRGANIFWDEPNKKCVIADTGMAFVTDTEEFTSMKSPATCRWTAPELMDYRRPPNPDGEEPGPSLQTDVFSFAMAANEIFTGQIPFHEKKSDSSVIFLILNGDRPTLSPFVEARPYLRKLLAACWAKEPENRPDMAAVCWKLGMTSYLSYALERLGIY